MPGLSADEGDEGAPPPSQSHFAKFEHFTPNEAASFDDEFARLASSQQWVPGSQEYTRQRTIAIKEELELHYFSQSQQLDDINEEEELSAEEKTLKGYQALCREVGIDPSDSIAECKKQLKNTLVNIVDLIDARRTGKRVKVWDSFEEFRAYTLLDENRIDIREAKRPPGYLASLLRRLSGPPSRKKRNVPKGGWGLRVVSGRITKAAQPSG
ncbi:hypothetical protein MYCTH_2119021 [Thermothelomyces thermophilus ATCC 42464]|uniref:Uncharacterized protein n=1 Tax=Thermothelomyces thermophilus (strain ATCC 42464 / BCRC 31852 / DSM 1799) TaxID=573729 RepID=G2QH29_THET4|nr:uncharacterized protein MYCTH_2119021 [Thermothelomyces thermophilus ATCC 42464]AEO58689.1 hypothetical protein MYCTH_2119021 [Thermothelomyces thermophilus ATCC 42464]